MRLLFGLPVSEGVLLRPADEPLTAPVVFDTESLTSQAMRMRDELQQQRLLVKRREMELLAAKNFLLPTLDLLSTYRARGLAVLREQERQIIHDLLGVVAEADPACALAETSLNRYLAAKDALDALEANREAGLPISLEQLLDSQRRLSEVQTRYHLAVTEYMVAIKNVQFESGTLLKNTQIMIAG